MSKLAQAELLNQEEQDSFHGGIQRTVLTVLSDYSVNRKREADKE